MPTSTIEDNDRLLVRLQQGDSEARQEIIERNMPLVIKCVEKLTHRCPKLKRYFDDLIGAGFLALTRGVEAMKTASVEHATGYLRSAIYHDLCEEICQATPIHLSRRTLQRYKVKGRASPPAVQSLDQLQEEANQTHEPLDRNLMIDDPNPEYFETLEDVLQCCHSDLECKIVIARSQGLTLEDVGQRVGRKKNTVSEILSTIQHRYDSTNLS